MMFIKRYDIYVDKVYQQEVTPDQVDMFRAAMSTTRYPLTGDEISEVPFDGIELREK